MAKTWANHTVTERAAVFANLHAAYEKCGKPSEMKNPTSTDEIVNILNAGQQQCNQSLSIKAEFPEDKKAECDALKKEVTEALSGVKDAKIDIGTGKGVGCQMGTIENVGKLKEDGTCSVSHNAGEVILLDFWATWCPPCQAPMKHNQEMLEKHAATGDWGKVRIIGMSIDQDKQKLVNHVEDKKWTSVEHYHARNGVCTADKEFKVRGVPHCLLVDTTGKIVWIGHPASRKLEDDINTLLAGKPLEGVSAGGDDDDEEEAKVEGAVDASAAKTAVDEFIAATKEEKGWSEEAKKIQRAFLVLVCQTTCDLKNGGSLKTSLDCHTVLMGPAASIDAVQAITKKISHKEGAVWKNNE